MATASNQLLDMTPPSGVFTNETSAPSRSGWMSLFPELPADVAAQDAAERPFVHALSGFEWLGAETCEQIEAVAMDMNMVIQLEERCRRIKT